jgi:hypothetical protein
VGRTIDYFVAEGWATIHSIADSVGLFDGTMFSANPPLCSRCWRPNPLDVTGAAAGVSPLDIFAGS